MELRAFAAEVDSEFLCAACHLVLVQPLRYRCQHEVCAKCAVDLCPACGTTREREVAVKTSALLSKLRIFCELRAEGCEWVGAWGALEEHRRTTCDLQVLPCRFNSNGCPFVDQRRRMPGHVKECNYRTAQCDACLKVVKKLDLEVHRARCDFVPVPCGNRCGVTLPRAQLEKHVATECTQHVVTCPLSEFGCSFASRRADMDGHVERNVYDHLAKVLDVLHSERREHQAVVGALTRRLDEQETVIRRIAKRDSGAMSMDALLGEVREQRLWIDRFTSGLTCVVDLGGAGHFKSLPEALAVAVPNEVIILRPGTYRGSIEIAQPGICIRGVSSDEAKCEIVSEADVTCGIKAKNVLLDGVCIVADGALSMGLRCDAEGFRAVGCTIHGGGRNSIFLATQSSAAFETCGIIRGSGVESRGVASFTSCRFEKATRSAIRVVSGECSLARTSVTDAALNGVELLSGVLRVESSCIRNCNYSNVDVTGGTAKIVDTSLTGSKKCGICVKEAEAALVSCDISESELPGVAALKGAKVKLVACQVRRGNSHGIVVKAGADVVLDAGCVVSENADSAFGLEAGANFVK